MEDGFKFYENIKTKIKKKKKLQKDIYESSYIVTWTVVKLQF